MLAWPAAVALLVCLSTSTRALSQYGCSDPPLGAVFNVSGGHYSGVVSCGNLFLATDIPTAPVVHAAKSALAPDAMYTLLLVDFDGNANGSYPDAVPPGNNSPVRHWVVRAPSRQIQFFV